MMVTCALATTTIPPEDLQLLMGTGLVVLIRPSSLEGVPEGVRVINVNITPRQGGNFREAFSRAVANHRGAQRAIERCHALVAVDGDALLATWTCAQQNPSRPAVQGIGAFVESLSDQQVRPRTTVSPRMVVATGRGGDAFRRATETAMVAHDVGYRVALVALPQDNEPLLSRLTSGIAVYHPILVREEADRRAHVVGRAKSLESSAAQRIRRFSELRARNWRSLAKKPARLGRHAATLALESVRGLNATLTQKYAVDRASEESSIPGRWRSMWPEIVDLETTFADALEVLSPDIVHVIGHEPIAGAALYRRRQREALRDVPWVYDAYEWLPDVTAGPPSIKVFAWLQAEREAMASAANIMGTSPVTPQALREVDGDAASAARSGRDQPLTLPGLPNVWDKIVRPGTVSRRRSVVLLADEVPSWLAAELERRDVDVVRHHPMADGPTDSAKAMLESGHLDGLAGQFAWERWSDVASASAVIVEDLGRLFSPKVCSLQEESSLLNQARIPVLRYTREALCEFNEQVVADIAATLSPETDASAR